MLPNNARHLANRRLSKHSCESDNCILLIDKRLQKLMLHTISHQLPVHVYHPQLNVPRVRPHEQRSGSRPLQNCQAAFCRLDSEAEIVVGWFLGWWGTWWSYEWSGRMACKNELPGLAMLNVFSMVLTTGEHVELLGLAMFGGKKFLSIEGILANIFFTHPFSFWWGVAFHPHPFLEQTSCISTIWAGPTNSQ